MLKTIAQDFLQLLYPNLCYSCGERLTNYNNSLCFSCIENLPYTNESIYQNDLLNKLAALSPITGCYAMCYYNNGSNLQQLIKELKYRNQPQIGITLGKLLGQKLASQSIQIDEIIPVPLHTQRQRQRGYNQASLIANGVSEIIQVPVNEQLLKRRVNTKSQTKRTKLNRFENVADIFITKEDHFSNKAFLLIDDVMTTGATMLSCADVLANSGANEIYLASLAKADTMG